MAIAFANFKIYSRSKGQSGVAAAAYRAATRLVDHRTNEVHDYSKREHHKYSEIYLPDGCSRDYLDREYLWNQVEKSETRKNSQLAKALLLALPKELGIKDHICLVKEFAYKYFVSESVPVDINIYDKNDGNPFAYILATTRRLFGDKFHSHKARDLEPPFGKGFIKKKEYWGMRWREFQLEYFERNQILLEVDEGWLIPQVREGHIRNAKVHYLKEENEFRKALSRGIIE